MKSKIATIALVFILPFAAYAFSSSDTGDSKAYCAKKVERMTKMLDLNPEQQGKLTTLYEEQRPKYKVLHEESRKQMETFLTKEQLAKMDAMKEKHHQKMEQGHHDLTDTKTPSAIK
jgi:Spy/CpxP family protein refolding chaperone